MFDGKGMIEALDESVAGSTRQFLVPELHELVAPCLLLWAKRGQDFRPLACGHIDLPWVREAFGALHDKFRASAHLLIDPTNIFA